MSGKGKDITIAELQEKRWALEAELLRVISDRVHLFSAETGVPVDRVRVELEDVKAMGKSPETRVTDVEVEVSLGGEK